MKKFALKTAVLAIGALAGVSAMAAAVNLDAASPTAIKYANEANVSGTTRLAHGAAADQTATVTFGASFGTDVTAYVRVDIAGGTFATNPTLAVNDSNAAAATVSVAQTGTGYVIFAVTPTSGFNLVSANATTIDTDTDNADPAVGGINVTAKGNVTLQYRLFETLTAAANPTSTNTLKDTTAKNYAVFQNALTSTVTALTKTADVAASPSYTAFTNSTGALAKVSVAVDTAVAQLTGAAMSAGALFAATSDVAFNGDFTFAKNDDGTYTGAALNRLFLRDNEDCTAGANTVAAASALSATKAEFNNIAAATLVDDHWLCATPEGTPEIAPGTFTIDVNYEPQTGFTVADIAGTAAGEIKRNGVRMVAPMTNQPAGWYSRLVLTNTGTSARQYTISAVAENGTTVTLSGAAASGTLAAGKTVNIDLDQLVTITGTGAKPRTSLVVTVNAPQSEIDGLYQISNGATGSISNHVLSYKN